MKFLTFVDLHEDKNVLKKIVNRAKKDDIDFVLTPGDITLFGKSLRYVLKHLNEIGKKVYLIPGNHESDNMINEVIADYPNCINFNKSTFKEFGYVFLGYGGGGFSAEDSEFRKISRKWYSEFQDQKTILVTHGPPYGNKTDLVEKRHVGNKDYRKFIERMSPKLMVCGHLHENSGVQDKLGKTLIINPGWEGMVIELD